MTSRERIIVAVAALGAPASGGVLLARTLAPTTYCIEPPQPTPHAVPATPVSDGRPVGRDSHHPKDFDSGDLMRNRRPNPDTRHRLDDTHEGTAARPTA